MDWIADFVIKRRANRTNVYIVETVDFKRINGFIVQLAKGKIQELLNWKFKSYVYDIQRGVLMEIEGYDSKRGIISREVSFEEEQSVFGRFGDPMNVIRKIDGILVSEPSLVVIKYVAESRHVEMLSDYLTAWSQDERLYDLGEGIEASSTVVVFTFNADLFPLALRKLSYVIKILPSTEEERREILSEMARVVYVKKGIKLNVPEEIVKASSGLNLHEIESAANESLITTGRFNLPVFTEFKLESLRDYGLSYIEPKRGFESVGGYDYLKKYVRDHIIRPLREPKMAMKYGLRPPRGILLYGPPGTGKTYFAKALAKETGLCVVALNPADFLRSLVGETERRVREVQMIVESIAPCIVLLDEYDQIAMPRSQLVSSEVSRRFANMLLEWFGDENRSSIIVGTTNFDPNELDEAFIRPGRIDQIVPVLPPDFEARKDILRVHTQVVRKVPIKDVDFDEIARRTYLYTGSELGKIVVEAAGYAYIEKSEYVTQKHFEMALENNKINVNARERELHKMIESLSNLKTGNVNLAFLKEALKTFATKEGRKDRFEKVLERI